MQKKQNALLLSTDTLPNYWLDLIFSIAKSNWFDGIDLAMRKWFDARDEEYVQKLSLQHEMPIYIVQTSAKLNQKELDKALDICQATNCDTICINAPKITDFKAYDFISDNLKNYKDNNPDIKFTVRNPKDSKLFALPIPEYRFSNVIDIVKKYDCYIWLDTYNLDIDSFENEFIRKIDDYAPYISVIYISDKTKNWKTHLPLWDWMIDLKTFFKKLKKSWYSRPMSIKLDFKPTELASKEKLRKQFKKIRTYYDKFFINLTDLDDDDDNIDLEDDKTNTNENKKDEKINDTEEKTKEGNKEASSEEKKESK